MGVTVSMPPKIRRKACPTCGTLLAEHPPAYMGRQWVVRADDGDSIREYHTWTCGHCDGLIRQEVGR